MVRSVTHLKRFTIFATDGAIGAVDDIFFDDERWAVRYVVVDTGKWLPGRRVLVTPLQITHVRWGEQEMRVSITRNQVANSPEVDTHKPVSRQYEAGYFDYYGYPYYWGQAGLWGAHPTPMLPSPEQMARMHAQANDERRRAVAQGDAHLRSAEAVNGHRIHATDGELGHVDDLLIDDLSWAVRYLVVDTSNWWFGKKVLISPEWIRDISWPERTVTVTVTRQSLKAAPTYDPAEHVDRQWELAYHGHLGRPGYWLDAEEAQSIKSAHSYLSDDNASVQEEIERRARPRDDR